MMWGSHQALQWILRPLKFLAVISIAIVLFVALTIAHCLIPESLILGNMESSLNQLDDEGIYPNIGVVLGHESMVGFAGQGNRIDNYTNMWMIQSVDSFHGLDFDEFHSDETRYDSSRRETLTGGVLQRALLTGWKSGSYWSGFRSFLKPLLLVMDIKGIRIIQFIAVVLSLSIATWSVSQYIGNAHALLLVLSIAAINPINAFINLDQAPDLIQSFLCITLIIWLAEHDKGLESFVMTFILFGMVEAFINCLIMPLVTLGLPLLALTLWRIRNGKLISPLELLALCLSWSIGYACSFLGVWVISAVADGRPWLSGVVTGLSEFLYRAGATDDSVMANICKSVQNNINMNVPSLWLLYAFFAFTWYERESRQERREVDGIRVGENGRAALSLLLISGLPFAWIMILNNHSMIHSWMVHDIFCISFWAISCATYILIKRDVANETTRERS